MFPDLPSVRHVLFCETCFDGVREISNRTDTDLEWETKKRKEKKTNRGENVQSVVYASVECDSLRLWSSGGVLVICSFYYYKFVEIIEHT